MPFDQTKKDAINAMELLEKAMSDVKQLTEKQDKQQDQGLVKRRIRRINS